MKLIPLYLAAILMMSALGCQSIVAPGQDRAQLEESGGTKWALLEYDHGGSHFVWIPTWVEGLINLSSPHASNCKRMTVLRFEGGKLAGFEDLGSDRERWVEVLRSHGRLHQDGQQGMDPLYLAVSQKVLIAGAPLEAVYFANGFPHLGPNASPSVYRSAAEIRRDSDALYYYGSKLGGDCHEVVIRDGKVAEIRTAAPLDKFWIPFYHPIVLP